MVYSRFLDNQGKTLSTNPGTGSSRSTDSMYLSELQGCDQATIGELQARAPPPLCRKQQTHAMLSFVIGLKVMVLEHRDLWSS